MPDIDHERLTEIFGRASKLRSTQRREYLDSTCAGDVALRAELDALLACAEPASSVFDAAAQQGVRGREVTPFLLDRMKQATGGAAVRANIALLHDNSSVAGGLAVALARG